MNKAAEPPSNAALSIHYFMQGYYSTTLPILVLAGALLLSGMSVGFVGYRTITAIAEALL